MSYNSWKQKRAEKLIETFINSTSAKRKIVSRAGKAYIANLIKSGLKPKQILELYKQNQNKIDKQIRDKKDG